jgi:hypothetical protein
MPSTDIPPGKPPEPERSASFLQVLGAVLSSLGIRKKASGERDTVTTAAARDHRR